MGKEFRTNLGELIATWETPDKHGEYGVLLEEGYITTLGSLHAFIEWLQEGPPKKRYRITRTFEARPDFAIAFEGATHSRLGSEGWLPLSDADVEEVWE